jgi:hypothetical protein
MPRFVYTSQGWHNLDRVDEALFNGNRVDLVVDGQVVDRGNPTFLEQLVSATPALTEWECIERGCEEDGPEAIVVTPVLAWGFTVIGALVPITATDMHGMHGNYGLREKGTHTVYADGSRYSDAEAWLKAQNEQERRFKPRIVPQP